jgi:hypothetical protein
MPSTGAATLAECTTYMLPLLLVLVRALRRAAAQVLRRVVVVGWLDNWAIGMPCCMAGSAGAGSALLIATVSLHCLISSSIGSGCMLQ